jgi:hypothetical protein
MSVLPSNGTTVPTFSEMRQPRTFPRTRCARLARLRAADGTRAQARPRNPDLRCVSLAAERNQRLVLRALRFLLLDFLLLDFLLLDFLLLDFLLLGFLLLVFLLLLFFDAAFFAGTFAPDRRASDSPIAIACLRLFTVLPERPLLSVPRLRSRIARATFFDAFFPYFAICAASSLHGANTGRGLCTLRALEARARSVRILPAEDFGIPRAVNDDSFSRRLPLWRRRK